MPTPVAMQKFTTPTDPNHASSYQTCARLQVPYVSITPARKYAYVQFDVYEMVKPHGLPGEQPADFVIDLYKCYARFFDLPKDRFSCAGGANNLALPFSRNTPKSLPVSSTTTC